MTQGGISSWNVKEGDAVQPGDVLAQVDTHCFVHIRFLRIRVHWTSPRRRRYGRWKVLSSRVL